MARALIVGCGCRGRLLGARLLERGWAVRGTSRREAGLEAIRAAGIEPALADPGQPGTMLELVGDVTTLVWLLGSAQGEPEELAAIHGPRLQRLLERLVETPVRGFVYEAVGSVDPAVLARGWAAVEATARTWRLPAVRLSADPQDRSAVPVPNGSPDPSAEAAGPFDSWLDSAATAVTRSHQEPAKPKG